MSLAKEITSGMKGVTPKDCAANLKSAYTAIMVTAIMEVV